MQLVSYSPHTLAFKLILYHSSRARRTCCCSTRLASSRPRTCTCMHTYYPYRLIHSLASNVLYRLALVLEIGTLTETARLYEMWDRATLNVLVEDLLKKSMEVQTLSRMSNQIVSITKSRKIL